MQRTRREFIFKNILCDFASLRRDSKLYGKANVNSVSPAIAAMYCFPFTA